MCIALFLSKRNSIHRFPQSEEHILRSLEFGIGVFHGFSLIFFFLVEQSSCSWEFDPSLQGRNSGRDMVVVCQETGIAREKFTHKNARSWRRNYRMECERKLNFFYLCFFLLGQLLTLLLDRKIEQPSPPDSEAPFSIRPSINPIQQLHSTIPSSPRKRGIKFFRVIVSPLYGIEVLESQIPSCHGSRGTGL